MATEIPLKVDIDLGEGAKSLKVLKQEFKDAQKELDGMTVGTKAYVEQLKKLGGIKEEIGDLNETIKAFNPDAKMQSFTNVLGGMASGFQAATGAMALFGTENEDLQKTLVKVQAAMAFSEGIKGLTGLKDAFSNLWLVIKANPLGAIISALTALTAIGLSLYTQFNMTSQATKDLTKELEIQAGITDALSRTTKRQIELLTAQGGSEAEIIALKKQLIAQQITELETSLKLHERKLQDIKDNDSIWEGTMRVIEAIQRKTGQDALANQTLIAIQKNKNERAEEDLKAIAKEKEDLADLKNAVAINALDRINLDKKVTTEYLAELEKRNTAETDARLKNIAKNKEIDAQVLADKQAWEEEQNAIALEKEEEANMLKFEQNQKKLEQNNADWELEQKRSADRIVLNKAEFAQTMAVAEQSTQAMAGLSNFLFDLKRKNLEKGSAQDLKVAKRQFQVNKALAITSNVISTIMGITNALSAQSVIPDPFGTILKVATAAAVGVSGTVATAKIASQKFDGGGSSAGGGGGLPSLPSPSIGSPPSINAPTNSSTLLNPDGSVQTPTANNQQPVVKAIVVETDITSSQKRVNTIQEQATIK